MKYTKISPLWPRRGPGTFDGVYGLKYKTMEEAVEANDIVVIDFVKDENDIIYFQFYHTKDIKAKRYWQLQVQDFYMGVVDAFDDEAAMILARKMLGFFP